MKRKSDVLALIEACKKELEYICTKEMSDDIRNDLENLIKSFEAHYNAAKEYEEDDKRLNELYEIYSKLYYRLKVSSQNDFKDVENLGMTLYTQIIKVDKETGLTTIKEKKERDVDAIDVDYEEVNDIEKKNKKVFGVLAGIGASAVALIIILNLAKENKRLKNEVDKYGDDLLHKESIIETLENERKADIEENIEIKDPEKTKVEEKIEEVKEPEEIITLDVNDDEMLYKYAENLKSKLPNDTLTTEEIINALKLANFDELENKSVFASRDELYKANKDLGVLTTNVGTQSVVIENEETDKYVEESTLKEMLKCITNNELDINNFSSLKEDKGYNIYKLYELCAKKLNDENEKDKVLYAKLFNEMTARKLVSFSLTPSSPISQYYLMLAMFNENMNASLNLTTNHGWGPTYGEVRIDNTVPTGKTGDTIDGTYGYICIEELINFLTIGNPDYSMYSIYADEVMIDKGLSR